MSKRQRNPNAKRSPRKSRAAVDGTDPAIPAAANEGGVGTALAAADRSDAPAGSRSAEVEANLSRQASGHTGEGQAAAAGDAAVAAGPQTGSEEVNDGQAAQQGNEGQQAAAASGLGDTDGSLDAGIPTDAVAEHAADAAADDASGQTEPAAAGEAAADPTAVSPRQPMNNEAAAAHYGSNVFAAAAAGCFACGYGGAPATEAFTGHETPYTALPIFAKAAEFLRQWPDGSAEAVTIHLRMKGFPDVPVPGPRELAAWDVFRFTLTRLDQVDQAEAAAKLAAEPPPAAPIYPGERSYQPEPGPFDPTGFSPGR